MLALWLEKIPYAVYLGIKAEVQGEDILFILPRDEKLVGNPTLPAIHGGVVGAFMEQAAGLHLVARMTAPALPKIINFSLDYLRPARLRDTYASCSLTRQGRQIANVSINAWQENSETPVAIARAHFLLPGVE
jgi:acyl-coenzyme A thioesterase PaaI-like protein